MKRLFRRTVKPFAGYARDGGALPRGLERYRSLLGTPTIAEGPIDTIASSKKRAGSALLT